RPDEIRSLMNQTNQPRLAHVLPADEEGGSDPPGGGLPHPGASDKLRLSMGPLPTITIYLPGPLQTYCAGASQLSIEASTVGTALEELERTQSALYRNICDETGTLRRHLNVFVNTDNIRDLDGV